MKTNNFVSIRFRSLMKMFILKSALLTFTLLTLGAVEMWGA